MHFKLFAVALLSANLASATTSSSLQAANNAANALSAAIATYKANTAAGQSFLSKLPSLIQAETSAISSAVASGNSVSPSCSDATAQFETYATSAAASMNSLKGIACNSGFTFSGRLGAVGAIADLQTNLVRLYANLGFGCPGNIAELIGPEANLTIANTQASASFTVCGLSGFGGGFFGGLGGSGGGFNIPGFTIPGLNIPGLNGH